MLSAPVARIAIGERCLRERQTLTHSTIRHRYRHASVSSANETESGTSDQSDSRMLQDEVYSRAAVGPVHRPRMSAICRHEADRQETAPIFRRWPVQPDRRVARIVSIGRSSVVKRKARCTTWGCYFVLLASPRLQLNCHRPGPAASTRPSGNRMSAVVPGGMVTWSSNRSSSTTRHPDSIGP